MSIKSVLGMAEKVSTAVSALGAASEAVPEVARHFSGGAAASIAPLPEVPTTPDYPPPMPVFPGVNPAALSPFYVPPVPVSDEDIQREAEVRAAFILARLRFGSSVTRNLVAEIIVKSTDQQTVDQWNTTVGGPAEPGSMVAKALKRLAIRDRLKNYKSPVTGDDGELVDLLKEGLYLDLKEQAQQGRFKKMSYDQILSKLIGTETFGLLEAVVEPLTELAKDSLSRSK
ncbi:hypothetical protein BWI97_14320 [Siphonobacter sp. BAB-5405]|uniref:hypothetical protein n=1 Tax=Siphonobacter sp. BAB-5405 TaxID=1864825 RepID=UPI000C7FAB9F|nr:hypothetical protein [Siphonobacter sp. BAB-5405]PMD95527.1 hypothetical protein BWI97_14320 [Siphonobacter sp. BAB-5405]